MPKEPDNLTWLRTSTDPETWTLGTLRGNRLYAVCAEVTRIPRGWSYQRWKRREDPEWTPRVQGGAVGSREAAMRMAAIDLVTRIVEEVAHA